MASNNSMFGSSIDGVWVKSGALLAHQSALGQDSFHAKLFLFGRRHWTLACGLGRVGEASGGFGGASPLQIIEKRLQIRLPPQKPLALAIIE